MLVLTIRRKRRERLIVRHKGEEMLIVVEAAPEADRLCVAFDGPMSFDVHRETQRPANGGVDEAKADHVE